MPVYVDKMKNTFRNMVMCHMLADTVEELHKMAKKIGLKKEWYQPKSMPHYDLSQSKRAVALKKGAIELSDEKFMELYRKYK